MFGSKKNQFVSIIKQDKQLKINNKILDNKKIFKEENASFVAIEPTMPRDALVKIDVLQKNIPDTYLLSLYDSSAQEIVPSSDVDVIAYESVRLDNTMSIVTAKNELALHNRYFADSGIDYLISPLTILNEYAKEFGAKNSLNVFLNNNILYLLFLDEEKNIASGKAKSLTPFEKIKNEQFTGDELVDQKLYEEVLFLEIQQFLNDAIEEYYASKSEVEFLEGVKFLYTLNPITEEQMEALHESLMVNIEYEPLDIQSYLNKFIEQDTLIGFTLNKPRHKVAPKDLSGWIFLTLFSLIAVVSIVYLQLSEEPMMEMAKEENTSKQMVENETVMVKEELDELAKNIPLTLPNHVMLNTSLLERVNMHFDLIPYDGVLKDLEVLKSGATFVTFFAVPTTSVEDMQTKLLNIYKDSKVLLKHQNQALLNVIIENNALVVEETSVPYARYNKSEHLSIGKATEEINKLLPLQSSMKFINKEQKDNLHYSFSVTSIVKSPAEFFSFINSLNNKTHSLYVDYPVVFSKLNEGLEIKYMINLFQDIKESPKLKK